MARSEAEDLVGVVTGLAWTEVGGELLSIEAVMMPGKGHVASYRQARRRDAGIACRPPQSTCDRAAQLSAFVRRLIQPARHPRARAGRRDPKGRPVRWCRHVHVHRFRADRAFRCGANVAMTGEDHAAWSRSADRWPERKTFGCIAWRYNKSDHPSRERKRSGRCSRQREGRVGNHPCQHSG